MVPSLHKSALLFLWLPLFVLLHLSQRQFSANLRDLRVATYNIRMLGRDPTDLDRLVRVLRSVDADVLALQEVVVGSRVGELAARMSTEGRVYAVTVSRCGGSSGLRLAFIYDVFRAPLRATREFPNLDPSGEGACGTEGRSGFVARFAARGGDVHLLNLHLSARASEERAQRRREQWRKAYAIAQALGARRMVLLGDMNSTGYLDDAYGEHTFIHQQAAENAMNVASEHLQCTEYFHRSANTWAPSMLDHVVASDGVVLSGSVRVHGYCAELQCAVWTGKNPPPEHSLVSDHCPVSFLVGATP